MYYPSRRLITSKFWYIRRSIDRSKKVNRGPQEYLSYIAEDGSFVFSRSRSEVLVFTSRRHASRYAPTGSGLTISSLIHSPSYAYVETIETQG